jgi:hypothetical protein
LNSIVAEIDRNEPSIISLDPAPGHKVLEAWIVGPTVTLAKIPFTIAKNRAIDGCQKLFVESL